MDLILPSETAMPIIIAVMVFALCRALEEPGHNRAGHAVRWKHFIEMAVCADEVDYLAG